MQASPFSQVNSAHQSQLIQLARESITQGIEQHCYRKPSDREFPAQLKQPGASFVTLEKEGQLRGCIGTIEAHQPLYLDVAQHAYDAAFRDFRFSSVTKNELELLSIHISVLTPMQAMSSDLTEAQFIEHVIPHVDGVLFEGGPHRSVFLPQVWQKLPNPDDFISQLKKKGGWQANTPLSCIQVFKFQVQEFGE